MGVMPTRTLGIPDSIQAAGVSEGLSWIGWTYPR
jgi:hypothetical protein